MIVLRYVRRLKHGRGSEALALVKAEVERHPPPHAARFYSNYIAPGPTLVMEYEFESLAELEMYRAEWSADPESAAFGAKLMELLEGETDVEIWRLE